MKAQTKETQAKMTAATSLEALKNGQPKISRKISMADRDLIQQVKDTSEGQFPFATVLSCIDSRVILRNSFFDQGHRRYIQHTDRG